MSDNIEFGKLPTRTAMHERYTPEAILRLASRNPVVQQAVMLWRKGEVTWDQAMLLAVVELADRLELCEERLGRMVSMEAPPPFPGKGKRQEGQP